MSDDTTLTDSLLPYAQWTEEALRGVARSALAHVGQHGLPGEHHFYLGFRTDHPGVSIPGHLKARFPQEMTIVLQHRFWDLAVDQDGNGFSVGLSFGGVASKLKVPFAAMTSFADPHVGFGLRFQSPAVGQAPADAVPKELPGEAPGEMPEAADPPAPSESAPAGPQVVSLDSFRRRPTREG